MEGPKLKMAGPETVIVPGTLNSTPLPYSCSQGVPGLWSCHGGQFLAGLSLREKEQLPLVLLLTDNNTKFCHFGGGVKTTINIWKLAFVSHKGLGFLGLFIPCPAAVQ